MDCYVKVVYQYCVRGCFNQIIAIKYYEYYVYKIHIIFYTRSKLIEFHFFNTRKLNLKKGWLLKIQLFRNIIFKYTYIVELDNLFRKRWFVIFLQSRIKTVPKLIRFINSAGFNFWLYRIKRFVDFVNPLKNIVLERTL